MHTFTLLLLLLAPTIIYAYPAASHNPQSLALVGSGQTLPRQIHNADYQANPSPTPAQDTSPSPTSKPAAAAPSDTVSKDKRAAVVSSSSFPEHNTTKLQPDVEESSATMKRSTPFEPCAMEDQDATTFCPDRKRQIHNADYQANPPPPSPNPAPAPSPSPANPPAAAQSEPAAKDKRAAPSFEHQKDEVDVQGNSGDASKFIFRRDDKVYGLRRRDVEEMTNINNRNFDHNAFTRWSRAEVDKMHAWSKSNM
ncbi:hypothetical protein DFH06DRAFT_646536 [Mycena polygramma]|nr:hypothetical protein DFH06DRAFT_646536 [Mycena polygramma]